MKTGYPSIDKTHLKDTKFFERNPIIPNISYKKIMDLMFLIQGEHYCVDSMKLRVTTKEMQKDSLMFAKAFLELGIKKGDIVCVSMPNYYQAIPVFLATNMIGAVTTYLNPYQSVDELIDYLNMYESKLLINYNTNKSINDKIKSETKVDNIITLSNNNINSRDFNSYINYKVGYRDDFDMHELENLSKYQKRVKENINGKNDALILYTSGSTGKPKSLLFTNENLVASCIYLKNSTHVPNVSEDDSKWMGVVPFMYPYGFGASVLQTFLSGREVILCPNISKDNLSYFYKKNPNLVFGSPAFLELTKRNLDKDIDLSKLKIFLSGGDYLSVNQSKDAIDFFKEHNSNISISNSSGTGETLGCSTNAMNIPYRPDTVGQLVLGPEYVILNEDNEECKYNEPGVLCTRGKHVFKGYYNNEELTNETMITYKGKTYYKTGNIGFLDENRYFTLIGRSSRFFIVSTLNKVYCELVQNAVANIDVVDSVAVVPKPNKEMLYESKAYVVLKDGYIPDEKLENYIIDKCNKPIKTDTETINLKEYEIPKSVTFLDKLPRTTADKIDYELLKNMALDEYNSEKVKRK